MLRHHDTQTKQLQIQKCKIFIPLYVATEGTIVLLFLLVTCLSIGKTSGGRGCHLELLSFCKLQHWGKI